MAGVSPTAKPVQANCVTQGPSEYKNVLDSGINAQARLGWMFAPHAQDTPNMTVRLEAGVVLSGVTRTELAAQNTATLSAPSTNPRIDLVVIDNATGAVSVIAGSESASPVAPALTAGKSPVALVSLTVGKTSITNADITDVRALGQLGLPTFGTVVTYDVGSAAGQIPRNQDISIPPSLPSGTVIAVASETVPSGFLECNGAAVSRSTYSALFTAIGVIHGYGDNSTTFNLPDYRGRFLRGWAHTNTRDPDKASRTAMATGGQTGDHVGSVQADDYKSHNHAVSPDVRLEGGIGGAYVIVSGAGTTSLSTASTGGNETRPVNAGVMFCIKY